MRHCRRSRRRATTSATTWGSTTRRTAAAASAGRRSRTRSTRAWSSARPTRASTATAWTTRSSMPETVKPGSRILGHLGPTGLLGPPRRSTSGTTLYSGNYLNWTFGPTRFRTRIDIVKDVASNLLDSVSGVNVGLMTFNDPSTQPGRLRRVPDDGHRDRARADEGGDQRAGRAHVDAVVRNAVRSVAVLHGPHGRLRQSRQRRWHRATRATRPTTCRRSATTARRTSSSI